MNALQLPSFVDRPLWCRRHNAMLPTALHKPSPPFLSRRCPKSANELRPWIAREVQAVAGNPGGGRGGATETRLVADVVEALLKDNDVDDQEGYCRVKEQV